MRVEAKAGLSRSIINCGTAGIGVLLLRHSAQVIAPMALYRREAHDDRADGKITDARDGPSVAGGAKIG
jgi:hypothetical protein